MKHLSKITDNLLGQPMFKLLAKAKEMEKTGQRIIHFEIGDSDFNSPSQAIEAVKKALDNNITHYTNSMGLPELREAVVDYTEKNLGFRPSTEQVLICTANAIIDFVVRCVANPGDEIIYPDPGFPTYFSVIKYSGMVPVPLQLKEENDFRADPKDLTAKITDKTRLIIINSPQNPTGSVITKEEIEQIARIAQEKDIYLLSDEVYSKLIYGKEFFSPSFLDKCRERTIILGSFSKNYSMTGWRLGFAIGPEDVIEKMGLLLQTIISCLPPFTQLGGRAVLASDHSFLDERIRDLKARRDLLVEGLNKLPGISCILPEGAIYAFFNVKKTGFTSNDYSEKLLKEKGVCVLPGDCFGKFGEGYIRICYASANMESIKEALEKMEEFHKAYVK